MPLTLSLDSKCSVWVCVLASLKRFYGDGRFFAFQLSHNIKSVTLRPNGRKLCCLMLTLKDTSFLTIDKVPLKDANEMRMYLDAVHQDRVHTGKCPSSNSRQWQLREGATLPCGFFYCCVFSPLATFPPDVTFRACCICADLSGSDPQFLLCAFLMMCLCHAERWAEMKQSGIVSVVCTLVFEKLVSLSHLDSLFLFFHFILVVWRIGTLLHTGKNGQYKGNP